MRTFHIINYNQMQSVVILRALEFNYQLQR